jgi:acyl carrier protein
VAEPGACGDVSEGPGEVRAVSGEQLISPLYELVKEACELTDSMFEEPMDPDLFLPDYLDSIGLTTLLTLIEDRWAVSFDDSELGPEMFETLATLAQALATKLPAQGSG